MSKIGLHLSRQHLLRPQALSYLGIENIDEYGELSTTKNNACNIDQSSVPDVYPMKDAQNCVRCDHLPKSLPSPFYLDPPIMSYELIQYEKR